MRRLKVSSMHTQEATESINKRYEKRETKREAAALIAAKLETAIEKELLGRLYRIIKFQIMSDVDQVKRMSSGDICQTE